MIYTGFFYVFNSYVEYLQCPFRLLNLSHNVSMSVTLNKSRLKWYWDY